MKALSRGIHVKGWGFLIVERAARFPRVAGSPQLHIAPHEIHNIRGLFYASFAFWSDACHGCRLSCELSQLFRKTGIGGVDVFAVMQSCCGFCTETGDEEAHGDTVVTEAL